MGFKRRFRRVEVLWRDSSTYSGWQDDNEPRPVIECRTAGYLVADTPDHVSVAQSHAAHNVGEVIVIPRECILEIRRI
jgi:hypothetical protein